MGFNNCNQFTECLLRRMQILAHRTARVSRYLREARKRNKNPSCRQSEHFPPKFRFPRSNFCLRCIFNLTCSNHHHEYLICPFVQFSPSFFLTRDVATAECVAPSLMHRVLLPNEIPTHLLNFKGREIFKLLCK